MNHKVWKKTPLALLLALALAGCASGGKEEGGYAGTARATVQVDNQAWIDMNIYVLRQTTRIRLGTVPGQSSRTFPLPNTVVASGAVVRFLADPVGGNYSPSSYELTIRRDQALRLTIPFRNY